MRKRFYRKLDSACNIRDNVDLSIKNKKSAIDCLPGLMSNRIDILMKGHLKHQTLKSLAKKSNQAMHLNFCSYFRFSNKLTIV